MATVPSREVASGIMNMGNTCYMNAVLQALVHAPDLCNAVDAEQLSSTSSQSKRSSRSPSPTTTAPEAIRRSSRHQLSSPSAETTPEEDTSFCCHSEVEDLLHKVHASNGTPVSPSVFVNGFIEHVAPPTFRLGQQEDSHEFLRLLIDAMQKSCVKARPKRNTSTSSEDESKEDVDKEYPFQLFRGTVESNVRCSSCKASSSKIDPIEDVGLEVVPGEGLPASFKRFTQSEPLSGYKCDHCGAIATSTKESRLASVPPILTIHLKRFRYGGGAVGRTRGVSDILPGPSGRRASRETGRLGASGSAKIDGHVQFGEILNLKPYTTKELSERQKKMFCRLFAVIVHTGKNSHSGHYIAYVRNVQKNEWWKMDDARVTKTDSSEVLAAEAYMLFYRMVEHPVAQAYQTQASAFHESVRATANQESKQEENKQSTSGSKKRKYESSEDWAKRRAVISDNFLKIFPIFEQRCSKRVRFKSSFMDRIYDDARDGRKSAPGRVSRDDVKSYSSLHKHVLRFLFNLHKQGQLVLKDEGKASVTPSTSPIPSIEHETVL